MALMFGTVLLTTLSLGQEDTLEPWGVQKLIGFHQEMYEFMQVQDVYKLLYQANFGVGHILSDSLSTLRRLEAETEMLGVPHPDELLMERISGDGEIIRVNLRPFKATNLTPATLVECMFRSTIDADTLSFVRQWNEFFAMVRYGVLAFPVADAEAWNTRVARGDFSPVSHSDAYRRAYTPAYRVVRRSVFTAMFATTVSSDGR